MDRVCLACVAVLAASLSPAAAAVRVVEVGPGELLSVADGGSGDAVLLLPSLTVPAFSFRRVVPLLAAAGRRVLVVEPLGLGGSSQPEAADYSLGAQADRVGRVLDAFQVGPVVVVLERVPGLPFLARHHYLHHLDTEANANFLLPLADWLFGTLRVPEPGADLFAAGRAMAPPPHAARETG